MTDNNTKEQLLDILWSKLKEAMKGDEGNDFIARSDIENGTAKINNNYFQQNEKIVMETLKDNATEEDDEKLTEHLKKIGTNIYRYKFEEKDENGIVNEYRFSFEEDKMIVNIRDGDDKIIKHEEFEYKDYFEMFFYSIIRDLSINDNLSIFSEINIYNSSIANTVLKYYSKDNIHNIDVEICSFLERENLSIPITLINVIAETGDNNTTILCYKKYSKTLTEYDMLRILESTIIGGNTVIFEYFRAEIATILETKDPISKICNGKCFFSKLILYFAACANKEMNYGFIQYLFNNYGDYYSGNDLLIASFKSIFDPRIARIILNQLSINGCNIYDINNEYCSDILCCIANYGSIEVMQYILNEMSKILTEEQINNIINNKEDYYKKAVLTNAIETSNIDMVRFLLLRPGLNINVKAENKKTPLHFAIKNKNIKIVKLLLDHEEIDVNITDENGISPLFYAVYKGNIEIVKLLLANRNTNINITDHDGDTPLYQAAGNLNTEIVKLLLTHDNIDVNKKNKDNKYPLGLAVQVGNIEIVRLLLTNDSIKVNEIDASGMTPLCKAIVDENIEMVKLLLANKNTDVNKMTPLNQAILNGNVEIVKLLLTNEKINLNTTNVSEESPLHLASRLANIEIIKLLAAKEQNLDINKKECFLFDNFSPLENCICYNNFNGKNKKAFICLLKLRAHYINEKIENIKDKRKEINKQIEILEDMKNRYSIHEIFIGEAIEEFKIYSNYGELKKSKCNIF